MSETHALCARKQSFHSRHTNGTDLRFETASSALICLIFCKNNASERNESLLSVCRTQLIFCKNNASERNESLLSVC